MKINLKRLALATASVGMLTIYGCGGGGTTTTISPTSGVDPTVNPTAVDQTNSTTVTPSLGQFSVGTVVKLTKPDGTALATGTIGDNGSVKLTYPASHTAPIVVTVVGAAGVKYFDEGTDDYVDFAAGSELRAVLPAHQTEAGVSALTDAAVANLEATGGLALATVDTVKQSNNKIAAVFGLTDILLAPTPVNIDAGRKLDHTSLNDQYALVLAAFAKDAKNKGIPLKTYAKTFADDLEDGILDGKQNTKALTNPMTADSMKAAYMEALEAHATPNSAFVAKGTPLVITTDVREVKVVSNQTDVQMAKALFSELRTTLNSFANNKATGFLDTKATSIQDDINANVAPELSKVSNRISVLNNAMTMYEDAKALTGGNTSGFTVGKDPTDASKPALIRSSGSMLNAWNGYSKYSYCWTDSATPTLITQVTCSAAGTDSADRDKNKLKLIKFVLTSTTSNQYHYTAIRYNRPAVFATGNVNPTFGTSADSQTPTDIPSGEGSLGKTLIDNTTTITSMTFNGTMPPSTASTGVDTIAISAVRTAQTGSNFHYALSGSVSTTNATTASKVVSLSLDAGTYFDADETDVNNIKVKVTKIVGTAQTAASKFTGTFDIGSVVNDSKGANPLPTALAFTGVISDLSTNGAGEFLTGKLEAAITNYNAYDSNVGKSPTNFMTGTVAFTGTVQAPARPQLKLVLAGTVTSLTASTMTLNYSYGTGISITGSGSIDTADSSKNTMTLSNQAGIQFVVKQNAPTDVTKAGVKLATISNNLINYIDGVSESF